MKITIDDLYDEYNREVETDPPSTDRAFMEWVAKKVEMLSRLEDEVRKMRLLQISYFQKRDRDILIDAKTSERIVDKILIEKQNPSLFP